MAPQTELIDETGRVVFRGTQSPGGGSQTLAEVLAAGNDGDGRSIENVNGIFGLTNGGGVSLDAAPGVAAAGDPGGAVAINAQDSDTQGGVVSITGGAGVGAQSGIAVLAGGGTDLAGTPATIVANGAGNTDGGVDIYANGLLTLDGAPFGRAAHVADGSTVDQLRNALIAAGLMAAS